MNTVFTRYISLALGLLCVSGAAAYSASDCTLANNLAQRGVINNQNNCNNYNLDRSISRQEVAAIALQVGSICGTVRNIPAPNTYRCNNWFSDVTSSQPNTWACRSVETLADNDVISRNGENRYGDVFFRPTRSITRAEGLSMILLSGGMDFRNATYDDWRFGDIDAASWQKPLMQYADDRDVITSLASFLPNTTASRRDIFKYTDKTLTLCNRGVDTTWNNNWNNTTTNSCTAGQYWSNNYCYSCGSIPTNAYFTTRNSCDWSCSAGYYKSGNTCVSNYNNNNNNYNNNYNYNSCSLGQYWSGNSCYSCGTLPYNAYYTSTNSCEWSCNSGYYKSGSTCVSNYNNNNYNNNYNYNSCSLGQYWSGNSCYSCGTLPYNAYYTSTNSCEWSCNSGYYKSGSTCVSNYNNNDYYYDNYYYNNNNNNYNYTDGYYWYTTSWNGCGVGCSYGNQIRTVECRSNNGSIVQDWYCSGTKPYMTQSCS